MKLSLLLKGALFGFMTSLVVMALSFLGNLLLGLPILPFGLFDWLARHLPGKIIETGIQSMVNLIHFLRLGPTDTTAKLAEQLQGMGLVAITGALFGLVLGWLGLRRPTWLMRAGLLGGVLLWCGMLVVELSLPQTVTGLLWGIVWLLALLLGWGWQLARQVSLLLPGGGAKENPPTLSPQVAVASQSGTITRRNLLAWISASLVSLFILFFSLKKISASAKSGGTTTFGSNETPAAPGQPQAIPYGPQYTSGAAASPSLDVLNQRIEPAQYTRPEITSVDDFFRIDINSIPPVVDRGSWRLTLSGLVNTPLSLSLDDLRARPSVSQAVTLSCISNPVGGDLIGSNYWTGVRLKVLLAEAGLQPTAAAINIQAVDGFYESVSLDEAMDERTLLVYAMNGEPLAIQHGFPLRVFIPGHYGMKQPKWITHLVAADSAGAGYWVDRGWSETAVPMTTSVIDTVTVDKNALAQTGIFPLGGIAYAGARGISKVELQIDSQPWVEAQLRNPPISPLTWVQWRFDWKPSPGTHVVAVRATDGRGVLQVSKPSNPAPEGATGIDTVSIKV